MKRIFLIIAVTLLATASLYASEPTDTSAVVTGDWGRFGDRTIMGWVRPDVQWRLRTAPSEELRRDTLINAWRGERIGTEALIVAPRGEKNISLRIKPLTKYAPELKASFLRYVLTTDYNTCGYPSADLPTHTVPDMIDHPGALASIGMQEVRPVWVSAEVERTTPPGEYTYEVTAVDDATGNPVATQLQLTLNVSDNELPAPRDYTFFMDLWQQPYAIPRYYGVEPWSDEHLAALRPYADMLGRLGQKTVTVILFHEPWGEQSNDIFLPMVETIRRADGSWAYDYTRMDRYVDFMAESGVDAVISCFTMVPWDMKFRYLDEPSGEYKYLEAATSTPEYEDLWRSFLQNLATHMKERGLYERTEIVMDERGLPDMLNARRVAQEAVPGIKMSLAGNYHSELVRDLSTYTLLVGEYFPLEVLEARRAEGKRSLLYTCCANVEPNLFSNSHPADAAYIPVYCTAVGLDGYLHWSATNWTDNPTEDTRFRMFAPGDTYFLYPDGRTSVRYERLLEGVQLSEKVRILRDRFVKNGDVESLRRLDAALQPIASGVIKDYMPTSMMVHDLHTTIDTLSRL